MRIIRRFICAGSLALFVVALAPLTTVAHPDIDTQIADLTHRIEEHPGGTTYYRPLGEEGVL